MKANCPEIRRMESRQQQRVIEGEWKEQIERRERVRKWHLVGKKVFILFVLQDIESSRQEKEM